MEMRLKMDAGDVGRRQTCMAPHDIERMMWAGAAVKVRLVDYFELLLYAVEWCKQQSAVLSNCHAGALFPPDF